MKLLITKYPHHLVERFDIETYRQVFGFLCIPNDMSPLYASLMGATWGMDNLAFKNFQPDKYRKMLKRYQGYAGCKFVVVPDVPGNARATLDMFHLWHEEIKAMGYPVALAAQDGIEDMDVQWHQFSALFVGGTDKWRFSNAMIDVVREARKQGKWVHLGRVNSAGRIRKAQDLNFDSCDGSSYATHFHKVATHLPYLQSRQLTLDFAA